MDAVPGDAIENASARSVTFRSRQEEAKMPLKKRRRHYLSASHHVPKRARIRSPDVNVNHLLSHAHNTHNNKNTSRSSSHLSHVIDANTSATALPAQKAPPPVGNLSPGGPREIIIHANHSVPAGERPRIAAAARSGNGNVSMDGRGEEEVKNQISSVTSPNASSSMQPEEEMRTLDCSSSAAKSQVSKKEISIIAAPDSRVAIDMDMDMVMDERANSRVGPPVKVEVNINRLPSDVLLRIFGFLTGPSLARCESVCKAWRSEIRDTRKSVELWKTICYRHGIVPEHFRRLDKERLHKWRFNPKRLAQSWRSFYIAYRKFVCMYCLKYEKRLRFPLYGNTVRLCKKCRLLEPYASLTTAQARKYFKFDPYEALRVLETVPATMGCNGGLGVLYRFSQVYEYTENLYGKKEAEKRANKTRKTFGIGKMAGQFPFLQDL